MYPDKPVKEFIEVKNLEDQRERYALMKSKNKNAKPVNTTDKSITAPFDPQRIIDDIETYMNTKMNKELGERFQFNEADRSTIISVIERAIHRLKLKKDEDARKHAGSTQVQTFTNTHGVDSSGAAREALKSKDLLARIAALKFMR